jgi:hypothetical protein
VRNVSGGVPAALGSPGAASGAATGALWATSPGGTSVATTDTTGYYGAVGIEQRLRKYQTALRTLTGAAVAQAPAVGSAAGASAAGAAAASPSKQ